MFFPEHILSKPANQNQLIKPTIQEPFRKYFITSHAIQIKRWSLNLTLFHSFFVKIFCQGSIGQFPEGLITLTEEILNKKLLFCVMVSRLSFLESGSSNLRNSLMIHWSHFLRWRNVSSNRLGCLITNKTMISAE